jgi:hypothetical protein
VLGMEMYIKPLALSEVLLLCDYDLVASVVQYSNRILETPKYFIGGSSS